MCGIGGKLAYSGRALSEDLSALERMSLRMRPRGPDGSGKFVSDDRRIGLVHRRLAIIDLSEAGEQPMRDPSTGLTIVFNGEIYNYRELRADLAAQGHTFRSKSDTEVLLKLYAEHGHEMLGKLRGMFAFALWDERRGRLLLARDPFGIKPLYIADDGRTLWFASQVKALLATGEINTTPDPAGEAGFFLWGHIPEPFTLYKEIRALAPGSSLSIDTKGVKRVRQYFSLPRRTEALEPLTCVKSVDEARAVLSDALRESVRYHLISDVSVGVFLSSGLDSCTLFALAAEGQPEPPIALTLGFREFENTDHDEVPLASLAARERGAPGQVHRISQKDFSGCYAHLMESMDQPSIDGINTYFVCKAAADSGLKVAISGVGGDELFGGYPDFARIPRLVSMFAIPSRVPGLGSALRRASAPVLKSYTSTKYAGLVEYGGDYGGAYRICRSLFMPWELSAILDRDVVREGLAALATEAALHESLPSVGSPRLKVSALFSAWYMRNQLLRDSDWASMCHSIELRTPLVDVPLWETVVRLVLAGHHAGKQDMARSPKRPLPGAVLNRRKTGFCIPVRDWLMAAAPDSPESGMRGLRGWSQVLARQFKMAGLQTSPLLAVAC
jgi:asparagine synthase (glutamine-hydrolysing)